MVMMPPAESLRLEEATFPCAGLTLARRSVLPAGPAWAHLGVLHGYGDHSGRYLECMRWLAARGVACHALDFRGQGRSSGRPGYVARWEEYLDDLDAFLGLECLGPEARGGVPLFLLGHSHGALVLAAAGIRGLEGVAGCLLCAPYFRARMHVPAFKVLAARVLNPVVPWLRIPSGVRNEWMSRDEAALRETVEDRLVLRTATPRWYLTSLEAQRAVLEGAPRFRLPLLMLAPDADPLADPRGAHDFFERAASEDKTYRVYPDHLHELLRERGRERVFAHIREWLEPRAQR